MSWVFAALFAIMGAVLVLPFAVKRVEEELELFLLGMGVLAATVGGAWSGRLTLDAVLEPVLISLAVLVFGLLFRALRATLRRATAGAARRVGLPAFLFLTVAAVGLLSSAATAIIAALVVVEVASGLRLPRKNEVRIVVFACFSIGLGAALTPIGEPLSTIVVAKLAGPPHDAGFFFLAELLGGFVVPGILVCAAAAATQGAKIVPPEKSLADSEPEEWQGIVYRALKVFVFVAALVLLSAGLNPIVDRFILGLPLPALYWINSLSAVLDNATLAAAEVNGRMAPAELRFLLMGLLVSGGMLIPGNIPNIVCAGKLGIKSGEWARVGVPFGGALMLVCFAALQLAR